MARIFVGCFPVVVVDLGASEEYHACGRLLRTGPERPRGGRKRGERPILLPGGDSGSPLAQSNRRGSLNNRLASGSGGAATAPEGEASEGER